MNNVKVLNAVCPPLNLISCAVCMFFVYIFLHALIGYKKKVRKAPLVVFCVVLAALSILPIFLPEYFDITDIADATSTLCFIVFPYLVLKPYKKKTAFLWIGIAMAASLDYFAFIINYTFKLNTIGQMSAKVILYVLVFIAIMLTSDRVGDFDTIESFDRFPPVASLMIFAAFLAAYYSVTVSLNADYSKETANALTMLSSVLIVGCIAYLVTKYLIALQRKRATEKQLELELNHYNNMVQKNRDMRVFRHDFKNNLTSVRALISDGQYGEAKKYIDELYGRLDATKNAFSTGNHFADAILAEKSTAAAVWQTKLDFDGIIPADGIENIDLCTILANALDNAVEASKLVDNAVISVHAVQDSAVFMLTVSNPTLHPVEIKNNTVKTTKLDSMNHGFGIGSIRSAAKKYNGEVNLKYENGYFTVEVMMIMRKGARNDEQ